MICDLCQVNMLLSQVKLSRRHLSNAVYGETLLKLNNRNCLIIYASENVKLNVNKLVRPVGVYLQLV